MLTEKLSPPYVGRCLCGSIAYVVDRIEPKMGHCHCSMCRKFHGAAYATFGESKPDNFRWTSGQSLLRSYVAENGSTRQFCGNCGSSMTFSPADNSADLVEFSLGTLDSDIDLKPDAHIFVESKACWVSLSDDLPKFNKGRDSSECA